MCSTPPFGGSNPPFSVFSNLQKNYSAHKKYVETKVVDLKELISGNFHLRTISLQIRNLRILKTFACTENEGMKIILKYSKEGWLEVMGRSFF